MKTVMGAARMKTTPGAPRPLTGNAPSPILKKAGGSVRRESKPEIEVPRQVTFALGAGDEPATGSIVRLSVVGVEIVTLSAPAVGREVLLRAVLVDG